MARKLKDVMVPYAGDKLASIDDGYITIHIPNPGHGLPQFVAAVPCAKGWDFRPQYEEGWFGENDEYMTRQTRAVIADFDRWWRNVGYTYHDLMVRKAKRRLMMCADHFAKCAEQEKVARERLLGVCELLQHVDGVR